MRETMEPMLAAWESFYVIVGSSAAALTGLQFVVITLVSDLRRQRTGTTEIDAFATPTVVHFGAVLLVSAILSAPFRTAGAPAVLLTLLGLAGVVYTAVITRRARRATNYKPVLEDWIWHVWLPFFSYGTLLAASLLFTRDEREALFAVAAVALMLLFIGIHNAWDTVTYISLEAAKEKGGAGATASAAAPPATSPREQQTPVELL